MKITIEEQALQQGVAAHNAGNLQEAERLYRAILQSQPKHPDANHNLGVLAVSVNKADAALPLFKTALEANPKIEQFWLSYIDALIKEKQFDNAKEVVEQAKKQGVAADRLISLEGAQNILRDSTSQKVANEIVRKSVTLVKNDGKFFPLKLKKKEKKHSETYSILIDTLISDKAEQKFLFNAIENIEVIKDINTMKNNLLDLEVRNLFKEYSNKNLALVIIEENKSKIKKAFIKAMIQDKNITKNLIFNSENLKTNFFYEKL